MKTFKVAVASAISQSMMTQALDSYQKTEF